jgi:hypothetical protein
MPLLAVPKTWRGIPVGSGYQPGGVGAVIYFPLQSVRRPKYGNFTYTLLANPGN